jgi:hypothetical protein
VPVEHERVSVEEFIKDPLNKWVCMDGHGYYEFVEGMNTYRGIVLVVRSGNPIYATNPTAWLAWKAEQEGKNK